MKLSHHENETSNYHHDEAACLHKEFNKINKQVKSIERNIIHKLSN